MEAFSTIFDPCVDGNVQTYVTDKELKQQGFRINRQNIQKATGIQVTFISEVKLQKETFLAKYDNFFAHLCVHFETPFRFGTCIGMPRFKN